MHIYIYIHTYIRADGRRAVARPRGGVGSVLFRMIMSIVYHHMFVIVVVLVCSICFVHFNKTQHTLWRAVAGPRGHDKMPTSKICLDDHLVYTSRFVRAILAQGPC